jgi:hypothetical protein
MTINDKKCEAATSIGKKRIYGTEMEKQEKTGA